MKKLLLLTGLAFLSIYFFSCASTESIPEKPELVQEENPTLPEEELSSEEESQEDLSSENEINLEEDNEDEESEVPLLEEELAEENEETPLEEIDLEEGEFITEKEAEPEIEDTPEEKQQELPALNEEVPLISDNKNQPQKDEPDYFTGVDINPDGTNGETVTADFEAEKEEPLAFVPTPQPAKENKSSSKAQNQSKQTQTKPSQQKPAQTKPAQVKPALEELTSTTTIDENQEESESLEENIIPEKKQEIIPSREVSLKNNQYLDVQYPGSGWVYLGELNDKTKIRYFGRKIGSGDTTFSLRTREEGDTVLHFYKNDALTGLYIDDYLKVNIKGKATGADSARVSAPLYEEVVPPRPQKDASVFIAPEENDTDTDSTTTVVHTANKTEGTKLSSGTSASKKTDSEKNTNQTQESHSSGTNPSRYDGTSTVIQNTTGENSQQERPRTQEGTVQQENSSAQKKDQNTASIQDTSSLTEDEILSLAQECYDTGKFAETLAYLNAFFEKSVSRTDEGLFLQGKTYESNSNVRNIRSALDTYETIVKRYPHSIHWAKANERIIYLRRFYINIR